MIPLTVGQLRQLLDLFPDEATIDIEIPGNCYGYCVNATMMIDVNNEEVLLLTGETE